VSAGVHEGGASASPTRLAAIDWVALAAFLAPAIAGLLWGGL
jgi:hypothetical protein